MFRYHVSAMSFGVVPVSFQTISDPVNLPVKFPPHFREVKRKTIYFVAISGQFVAMNGELIAIGGELFAIGSELFAIGGELFAIGGNLSTILRHLLLQIGELFAIGGNLLPVGGNPLAIGGNFFTEIDFNTINLSVQHVITFGNHFHFAANVF